MWYAPLGFFLKSDKIITKAEIVKRIKSAGITTHSEEEIDSIIDHLVDLTIIGREIKDDEFEFEFDLENSKKLKVMAEKKGTNRFLIHEALVPYLECV